MEKSDEIKKKKKSCIIIKYVYDTEREKWNLTKPYNSNYPVVYGYIDTKMNLKN